MDAFVWVLAAVGVAVLAVVSVLTARQLGRGGTPPGPPMGEKPLGTHDEPLEDSAKPVDAPRHERSAHDVAEDGRDVSRITGGG